MLKLGVSRINLTVMTAVFALAGMMFLGGCVDTMKVLAGEGRAEVIDVIECGLKDTITLEGKVVYGEQAMDELDFDKAVQIINAKLQVSKRLNNRAFELDKGAAGYITEQAYADANGTFIRQKFKGFMGGRYTPGVQPILEVEMPYRDMGDITLYQYSTGSSFMPTKELEEQYGEMKPWEVKIKSVAQTKWRSYSFMFETIHDAAEFANALNYIRSTGMY